MSQLMVHAGDFTLQASFEEQLAPKTVAAFHKAMPFENQAIHVRRSGEGSGCRWAISIPASPQIAQHGAPNLTHLAENAVSIG